MMKKVILSVVAGVAIFGGVVLGVSGEAFASCAGVDTNIINCEGVSGEEGGSVFYVLRTVLQILSAGVGVLGILGVVIAGLMYLTARDNEAQVATAKKRLMSVAVGMLLFAVLGVGASWLMPGGLPEEATKETSSAESGGGDASSSGGAGAIGSREEGSEDVPGPFGNVGSGDEGWADR